MSHVDHARGKRLSIKKTHRPEGTEVITLSRCPAVIQGLYGALYEDTRTQISKRSERFNRGKFVVGLCMVRTKVIAHT